MNFSRCQPNTASDNACVGVAVCSHIFRPALTREENVEIDSRTKLAVLNEYVASVHLPGIASS